MTHRNKSQSVFAFLAVCLALVIPEHGMAKSAKKERAEMAVISKDIVAVCLKAVVNRKPMGSVVGANGFALSDSNKLGASTFDKVYVKIFGKGWGKTTLQMASPEKGTCLAKVSGNWESKALWANVDAGLVAHGSKRKRNPIIASGMYIGSYKKGAKTFQASGDERSPETLVIMK